MVLFAASSVLSVSRHPKVLLCSKRLFWLVEISDTDTQMSGFSFTSDNKARFNLPTPEVIRYPAVSQSRRTEGVLERCSSYKPLKGCLAPPDLVCATVFLFLPAFFFPFFFFSFTIDSKLNVKVGSTVIKDEL